MKNKALYRMLLILSGMLIMIHTKSYPNTKSLTIERAGTLDSLLGSNLTLVDTLTLQGPINGTDIATLRLMTILSNLNLTKASFVEGGMAYYSTYKTRKDTVSEYMFFLQSNLTTILLPENVRYIGDNAFSNCANLSNVTIPTSIESIGISAFSSCRLLTSVNIPENVKSIGSSAFIGCVALTSIQLPASVKSIGASAFSGCIVLKSIVLPPEITIIEHNLFDGCTGLASYQIPVGVKNIGQFAFNDCTKLQSVSIPSTLETIEASVFSGCTSLTDVNISSTVSMDIPAYMFSGCSALKSFEFPSGTTSIGPYAFYKTGFQTVTIPASVQSIGSYAYAECPSLTQVNVSGSVKYIFPYAFYKSTLTTIEIPHSVTFMGGYAFRECLSLKTLKLGDGLSVIPYGSFTGCPINEIHCGNVVPYKVESTAFDSVKQSSCQLFVPSASSNQYAAADFWKAFNNMNLVATNLVKQDVLDIYVIPGAIVVRNTIRNEVYSVYSTTGAHLKTFMSPGGEIQLEVPSSGLYLIKNQKGTSKVRVFDI